VNKISNSEAHVKFSSCSSCKVKIVTNNFGGLAVMIAKQKIERNRSVCKKTIVAEMTRS
jgi:hypothetical protein